MTVHARRIVAATLAAAGLFLLLTATAAAATPPVIIKAFGAASIPLNAATSLTFTIQNNNAGTALTGVGFTDDLPSGLTVSTPNGLTGSCGGGTITATAGGTSVNLNGATIAAASSCTFSINVRGTSAGLKSNTTGNVTSANGGTGGTASASIKVEAPPSIAKAFNPSTIALNATTSLTFTITNPSANVDALTGVAFSDLLPTGLTVANASATVCGGTLTTTAPNQITLTGATVNTSSACQFSVTVTGSATGHYLNTTGAVTATNGGTGNTASANLDVAGPPTITKTFGAAKIPLNGTTSLTFDITNPNPTGVNLSGVAFTDNLPAGLTVAPTPSVATSCGGTVTATAGAGSVTLASGAVPAGTACQISLQVQGITAGVKNNSVQVTSTEGGTGNTSNASITVVAPPVIIKAFGAASIPLNASTSLTFTIQNNNATTTLNGVAFTDALPAGLVVATPNGLSGACGGGTITATAGATSISLSGGSLASSSSCTFSVNVRGVAPGLRANTTGNVTSTEGGTGGTASASIKVEAPPAIVIDFAPAKIGPGAPTTLTFTITNPAANANPLTGVAVSDTLPTGLTVANGGPTSTCGGALTTSSPNLIALSGATIAVGGQCQFSVPVDGTALGHYTNTTGAVTSTNGGTGTTASAGLFVALPPPTLTTAFDAATIPIGGTSALTFTIHNPNAQALTAVGVSDALPDALAVAAPNDLTGSCGGGTISAPTAGTTIALTGATLPAGATCTFSVNVAGVAAGDTSNTTGPVGSTESGDGGTATSSIKVLAAPSLAASFGARSVPVGGSTALTFTVANPAPNSVALTGVGFSATLPDGLVVATPNGLIGSCGSGTITAGAGSASIALVGASIPAGATCTFAVDVTGTSPGSRSMTTSAVTSANGGTGNTTSAPLVVGQPKLNVAKSGTGAGTVTGTPGAIACGATCTATFVQGDQVTLTAVAATGSTFKGWSGGGCSGTAACQLTLTADTTVTAVFDAIPVVAPPTDPFTGARMLTTSAKVVRGVAKVRLGFASGTPAPITGRLTTTMTVKRKRVTVATASFTSRTGAPVTVKLRLTRAARKLLAGRAKLVVSVKLVATDARGLRKTTTKKRLTLRR